MTSTDKRNQLLWRIFPDVRPREREKFGFFAALSFAITLGQTVGLAGADGLFLAELGTEALPLTFIIASAATVSCTVLYVFAVGRARNDRLYVYVLVGGGLLLLVAAGLLPLAPRPLLIAIFCATYATQAVYVNLHFWTFATDYFDTLSSKRILPYLVMCGSVGGIAGGVLGVALLVSAATESLIVVWALALVASGALVHFSRRNLLRWAPVGEEADESSAENLAAALRYLQRSPLARWLTLSVVGMVLSIFILQYLEMGIMRDTFETPEALASFFAIYLAVTNGIEIVVSRVLTPALLRRFGVAQANLVHPLLTLLTFLALAIDPRLYMAVLARANREMMDNALAGPVRSLSYNALSFRFRGRLRALLDGIVFYAAMSIAGTTLVLIGDVLEPRMLCLIGAAAATVYAGANLIVRREYLRSLVTGLRTGRLDLDAVGADLGDLEMTRLAEQWEESLAGRSEIPRGWLELPALLARHGVWEPLRRNVRHELPAVRVACLEALVEFADAELAPLLADAVMDPDADVRLVAAHALAGVRPMSAELLPKLRDLLQDSDARIRAEAASQLGDEAVETLREMAAGADPQAVQEALLRIPRELAREAYARLADANPAVRAAAIECVTRLSEAHSFSGEQLARDLDHAEPGVRKAAARALGARGDATSAAILARALDDGVRAVRGEAAEALAKLGETGVQAALPAVRSRRRWTADAGLLAVAHAGADSSRAVLENAFRERVGEAWRSSAAIELLPAAGAIPDQFLLLALEDERRRSLRLAFRALEFLEDPAVVRSVEKAVRYTSARARADSLEVLSNLGPRQPAQHLQLLLEEGSLAEKLPSVAPVLQLPKRADEVLSAAEESDDRWLLMATAGYSHDELANEVPPEVNTMERLLALRRVPLFAHLSLEQLEAIGVFLQEDRYVAGEVVVRQDEPGEELYVIIDGEAKAFHDYGTATQKELSTMVPDGVCYFGEIAIFAGDKRSATVVVTKDARLLKLAGERFMELILQAPEISFEILQVLTRRLRKAEDRLRAQEDRERADAEK